MDLAFVLFVVIWKVPKIQTRRVLDVRKRFAAESEARKTVLQIVSGLAVLATIYSVVVTARNSAEAIELARSAQLSERFSKATEQLSATLPNGQKNIDARVGAIYALEAIARQSPDYHPQIMEILTAYLRNNFRWQSMCSPHPSSCSGLASVQRDPTGPFQMTAPNDVQTIILVLARRDTKFDSDPRKLVSMLKEIDMSNTDFRGTMLSRGERSLEDAIIEHSNLEGVNWTGVSMDRARFTGSCMARAQLWADELDGAEFDDTDLTGAYLNPDVVLRGATLRGASLRCARIGADLTDADLTGAHLEGANLKPDGDDESKVSLKQIEAACIDEHTVLPDNARRQPRASGSCR